MSIDPALLLFDRRIEPPEPFDICPDCKNEWEPHESWCPTHPSEGFLAERAYYDGPDGTPCPCCELPKPDHEYGCWMRPEGEPSYRATSADFQPGGRYDEEEY